MRSSKVKAKIKNLSAILSFEQTYLNQFPGTVPNASFFFTPIAPFSSSSSSSSASTSASSEGGGLNIFSVPALAHLASVFTRPATITSFEAEILQSNGSTSYISRHSLNTETSETAAGSQVASTEDKGTGHSSSCSFLLKAPNSSLAQG
jgi:hypothetical protein